VPEERKDDKEKVLERLRKIEGQVRGLQRMVTQDRYCVDILIQVAAARAALNHVGLSLLETHTRGCVARALREQSGDEVVDELVDVLARLVT
jgi:DNA-binding FrmR family transcriptional regulator